MFNVPALRHSALLPRALVLLSKHEQITQNVLMQGRIFTGLVQCSCPPACHSYDYELSMSSSPWPAGGPETQSAYHDLIWIDEEGLQYLQEHDEQ